MLCLLSETVVFFFKQKTAYEMRISDWSSDVCSSDLAGGEAGGAGVLSGPSGGASAGGTVGASSGVGEGAGGTSCATAAVAIPSAIAVNIKGRKVNVIHDRPLRMYPVCSPWEIGRASCRERVCQLVSISVLAVYLKKTIKHTQN